MLVHTAVNVIYLTQTITPPSAESQYRSVNLFQMNLNFVLFFADSTAILAQLDIHPNSLTLQQSYNTQEWLHTATTILFLGLGCIAVSGTTGTSVLISDVQCEHASELPEPSSHQDKHADAHILHFSLFTKRFTVSLKFESMFFKILTWQDG